VKSMTGYGQGRAEEKDFSVAVEIQSYNHRFLDIQVKMPPDYARLEPFAAGIVKTRLSRGRVNVYVDLKLGPARCQASINPELAEGYWKVLGRLERRLGCPGGFRPDALLGLPGVLSAPPGAPPPVRFRKTLKSALGDALDKLEAMREREGRRLALDLGRHLRKLSEGLKKVRRTLSGRADPNVNEEMERLEGHIEQFAHALADSGPAGKTLEFIAREMLREVTTLSDKSDNYEAARAAVEMKVAIESIREQVRNAE